MRPQVRAHSKSRAASEVRGCQSYLRPKVFSLYIQDTQVASREREREREIPGALLKAEDSAIVPKLYRFSEGPLNSMSTVRLPSGRFWGCGLSVIWTVAREKGAEQADDWPEPVLLWLPYCCSEQCLGAEAYKPVLLRDF